MSKLSNATNNLPSQPATDGTNQPTDRRCYTKLKRNFNALRNEKRHEFFQRRSFASLYFLLVFGVGSYFVELQINSYGDLIFCLVIFFFLSSHSSHYHSHTQSISWFVFFFPRTICSFRVTLHLR